MRTELIENFPQWALSAVINNDLSGMSDEDKTLYKEWLSKQEYNDYTTLTEDHKEYSEGYFSTHPEIGHLHCQCETIIGIFY